MLLTNAQRAEVLCNALPYIQNYTGRIVVVKYGGNAMINEEIKRSVMGDLVLLRLIGIQVVLVHGGGPEISGLLKRIGKESRFIDGLRVTDAETMDVVQMVLSGKVNKGLVSLLQSLGGKAIGLSGIYDLARFWGSEADDLVLRCSPLLYLQENGIANKLALAKAEENSLILCAGQGAYEDDAKADTQALADLLKAEGLPAHLELWGGDVSHEWYWWGKMLGLFVPRILEQ